MKKYLSLILALVIVVTAIPFTAINASAATMYKGDANGDGDVTAIDARTTLQVASGNKEVDAEVFSRIDMNGDGNITAIDARNVLKTASGAIEKVPVNSGIEMPTPEELKDILFQFGYIYDEKQNIFYTDMNPWQRSFGFADIYDNAAAYAMMWYMTLKIDFEYEDLLWRLQWWKGQYGVLEGAELGVYTKDPTRPDLGFYKCASEEHLLEMYFEYYQTAKDYNEGNCLFIRERQEHWWLTGFKFGVCDPTKNVIKASLFIEDEKMADGIEKGLKNVTDKTGRPNGFKEYKTWLPIEVQGHNFYIREKLSDGRTKFTVVWKDAGYLNYGEEHVCDYGEPVVVKAPTCVDEGVQRRICTICEFQVEETIPATGEHTMGLPVVTTIPGCATEGATRTDCIHCDYFETGSVPATGLHIYGDIEVVTPPTCTDAGEGKKPCINCDHFVTETIPATGHDMNDAVVDVEPTCTAEGVEKATCKNCDYFETTPIPATGHDMDVATTVTEPTCTTAGEEKAECKNCDHYELTPIPATGHDMSDWNTVTEPTTEADGLKEKVCQNADCGEKETEIIPKLTVEENE